MSLIFNVLAEATVVQSESFCGVLFTLQISAEPQLIQREAVETMMKTGLWELQTAVTAAMRAYEPLASAVTGIYDDVEPNATLPYVALGSDTAADASNKTFSAEECTMTISTWSGYKGKKEAKTILDYISQALTEERLVLGSGFECGTTIREMIEVFKESDTVYHGVVRFRFTINQV